MAQSFSKHSLSYIGLTDSSVLEVRDWAEMAPNQVTFKNCFKVRKFEEGTDPIPVPHSFTYMARANMPYSGAGIPKQERVPRALRGVDAGQDIFALVKSTMSSKSLCQDPLLCLPSSCQEQCEQFVLRAASGEDCPTRTWSIQPERLQELRLLSRVMVKDFPHRHRVIRWYQSMQEGSNGGSLPQLNFLKNAPTLGANLHEYVLPPREAPPKPHQLQVVFHRG